MTQFVSFFLVLLLVVGISCSSSNDLNDKDTKYEELTTEVAQDLAPNNLTVSTKTDKTDTDETTTDTLGQGRDVGEGRTFAIRRLQLILLPLMYKFGVMSTLIVLLFGISLKILAITSILLFIKVSSLLAKWHHHHEPPHHEIQWSPPPPQPFHVHLHHDEVHDPHEYESHEIHHDHHDKHDHHEKHVQDMVYSGWEYPPPSNPYEKTIAMDKLGQYVMYKG